VLQDFDIRGYAISLAKGQGVCIGHKYLYPIDELTNPVLDEVQLYIKPKAVLCPITDTLLISKALGIGDTWTNVSESSLLSYCTLEAVLS
jgi:hypothetical protein